MIVQDLPPPPPHNSYLVSMVYACSMKVLILFAFTLTADYLLTRVNLEGG